MAKKLNQQTTISSITEAGEVMRELKDLTTVLKDVKVNADARILEIQEEVAREATPVQERVLALETTLKLYAETNKDTLFSKQKTIKTPYGVFGFRIMPASVVVKMKRVADVVEALIAGGKRFKDYIKIKKGLDKNALKSAYDQGAINDRDLKAVGLAIEAREEFVYSCDSQDLGAVTA